MAHRGFGWVPRRDSTRARSRLPGKGTRVPWDPRRTRGDRPLVARRIALLPPCRRTRTSHEERLPGARPSHRSPAPQARRRLQDLPGPGEKLPGPRRFGRRHGEDLPMPCGARTRASEAPSIGKVTRSTTAEGSLRSAALGPRRWEVPSRSAEARFMRRQGVSRRSEGRFRSSELGPRHSELFPMPSEVRTRSSAMADRA
jgi:hypothetical protein